MKLVIMTKSTFFVEEDKILEALFDAGMDNLHLFKPVVALCMPKGCCRCCPKTTTER